MLSQQQMVMAPPGEFPYRTPRLLPFELAQHAGIFFEEKLYTRALHLLFNTLASGTYASRTAIVPLPQHLALAATLLVHPSTTTRAKSNEEKDASDVALRLLRLYSAQISPVESKYKVAFNFIHSNLSRSGRRYHEEHDSRSESELRHSETRPLNLMLGTTEALWARAEDFWHAVGWAFNCSVLYPERWEYWQIWLRFMCEVIEDDWDQREKEYEESKNQPRSEVDIPTPNKPARRSGRGALPNVSDDLDIFRQSLIFQYISSGARNGNARRIIRALFADGSTTSLNEFRQVFNKELVSAKSGEDASKTNKREREVDVDQELYGDYMTEDESEDEPMSGLSSSLSRASPPRDEGSTVRRSKRTRRGTRGATEMTAPEVSEPETSQAGKGNHHSDVGVAQLGGLDSLGLRKKLFGILSRVSDRLNKDFVDLRNLYQDFAENVRRQPLPIFQAFVSPLVLPELDDEAQTTLCEVLTHNMIESAARTSEQDRLTDTKLEECFLPFTAATASVVDNAKFSILLESMTMSLAMRGFIKKTPLLKRAVHEGIARRAQRTQEDSHRGHAGKNRDALDWSFLLESGERLVFLVDLLPEQ
ncbi:Uncharacterized protein PECH_005346 [Penicillium ucsense]|uniref:Uncharacterized protein n=1 Tax=Penicillium ucsense TaxID=2839758 RepID=A0A8J8W4N6_9EURO|nr:Uncharacterized protein PECM_004086 [Penicillium ucsense]KAF7736373.1 Uncharacterized protein PECH_005346 [Penicillium ucsense]